MLDAWMIGEFSLSVQVSMCLLLAVEDSPTFVYPNSSISRSGPACHMAATAEREGNKGTLRASFPHVAEGNSPFLSQHDCL